MIIIVASLFESCNFTSYRAECNCSSQAIQVNLIDEVGNEITADSIQYKFENEAVETIRKDSNGIIYGDVGYRAGIYMVWAFFKGNSTDSINVSVSMGGPNECRRPSTQNVELIFKENKFESYELKKIGGCGE